MLLNVISRPGDAFAAMRHLLEDNHEPRHRQRRHILRAIAIYRALRTPGIVEELPEPDAEGTPGARRSATCSSTSRSTSRSRRSRWRRSSCSTGSPPPTRWTCCRCSRRPSTTPRPVLYAQQSKAKGEAVAAMKADGIEYEERMALLEDVTWPKPLDELLHAALETYRRGAPWVEDARLVAEVGGARHVRAVDDVRRVRRALPARPLRGAGAALPRRRLPRAAPDRARRGQDRGARPTSTSGWASWCARSTPVLLDEWEALAAGAGTGDEVAPAVARHRARRASRATSARSGCWCATRCSAGSSSPRSAAGTSSASSTATPAGTPRRLARGAGAVLRRARRHVRRHRHRPGRPRPCADHDRRRSPSAGSSGRCIDDPAGDRDWAITAEVDLAASDEEGGPVVWITGVEAMGGA